MVIKSKYVIWQSTGCILWLLPCTPECLLILGLEIIIPLTQMDAHLYLPLINAWHIFLGTALISGPLNISYLFHVASWLNLMPTIPGVSSVVWLSRRKKQQPTRNQPECFRIVLNQKDASKVVLRCALTTWACFLHFKVATKIARTERKQRVIFSWLLTYSTHFPGFSMWRYSLCKHEWLRKEEKSCLGYEPVDKQWAALFVN